MSRKEKVTKIIDGDTFETASRKNPVRLANVDASENGQPGSAKAKESLSKLIEGEEVRIDTVTLCAKKDETVILMTFSV